MNIDQQIAEHTVKEMKQLWGGRLPTWEDYKEALNDGRVRASKTVANEFMNTKPIPRVYFILYNIITIWLGLLIFPATVIAWFFLKFSAFWILGAGFAAWFFVKVSREGQCEGIKVGAERDEAFYEVLVESGAFLFSPK